MTMEEEHVRAFYSQKEYRMVMKEIGGVQEWKKLNWKERLKLLKKNKKEMIKKEKLKKIERQKKKKRERLLRIGKSKPPPLPPKKTKVMPFGSVEVSEGASEIIDEHTEIFQKKLNIFRKKK